MRPQRGQTRAGQETVHVAGGDPAEEAGQQDVTCQLLRVDPDCVQHQALEHRVRRHEQPAEHHQQRQRDDDAAGDGARMPPARSGRALAQGRPVHVHERHQRTQARAHGRHRHSEPVPGHAGAPHPRRAGLERRQRERARRRAARQQLQRGRVAPGERRGEGEADAQQPRRLARMRCHDDFTVQGTRVFGQQVQRISIEHYATTIILRLVQQLLQPALRPRIAAQSRPDRNPVES